MQIFRFLRRSRRLLWHRHFRPGQFDCRNYAPYGRRSCRIYGDCPDHRRRGCHHRRPPVHRPGGVENRSGYGRHLRRFGGWLPHHVLRTDSGGYRTDSRLCFYADGCFRRLPRRDGYDGNAQRDCPRRLL